MPILGNRNSMNELYLKSIHETLNEDRKIYKSVFDLEKKQVEYMQPQQMLETQQLTPENLQETERAVDLLSKKLEEINNDLSVIQTTITSNSKNPNLEKYKSVMEIFDVLTYYNSLMRTINNPALGQNVKSLLENALVQLIPLYQNIVYNYLPVIHTIFDKRSVNGLIIAKSKGLLPQIISAYAVFKLMLKNLQNRNYQLIKMDDVSKQFTDIVIKDFPQLKHMEEIHELASKNITALLQTKYDAFEQENGRQPNDAEKQQIQRQLQLSSGLQPIFTHRTQDLLGQVIDEKKNLIANVNAQILNVAGQPAQAGQPAILGQLDNEGNNKKTQIDNEIAQKRAEIAQKRNEFHQTQADINNLQAQLPRKQADLTAKTTAKNHLDGLKKRSQKQKDDRLRLEREIPILRAEIQGDQDTIRRLTAEQPRLIAEEANLVREEATLVANEPQKKLDIDNDIATRKQNFIQSINKNLPQQQGNGKPQRKVYLQRHHNPQLEYNENANDPYYYSF